MPHVTTRQVRVGDYRFACRLHGDPGHDPVLFLHGFLGSSEEFDPQIARLADRFRCIAVDLPGHGATRVYGGAALYRMAATADGLARLLAALGVRATALVGYSMGGRLALYLAARRPALCRRITLISASPGLAATSARQQRIEQDLALAEALLAEGLPAFLARWYAQPLFASLKAHPGFAGVLARRRRNDPRGLALSLRHLGTGCQPSLWSALPSLGVPLQLLVGERDAKFVAIAAEMARLCPAARLEVVAGCGHALHLEAPHQLADRLLAFLGEAATPARA